MLVGRRLLARYYFIPSVSMMKDRDVVDFMRIALISVWAAESFQFCAFWTLSNAMMTNRNGATPSSAVM
jgi:hypothetical protein